jgi:hypothetical protein
MKLRSPSGAAVHVNGVGRRGKTDDHAEAGCNNHPALSYPGTRTRYRLLCVVRLRDRCADANAAGDTLRRRQFRGISALESYDAHNLENANWKRLGSHGRLTADQR